MKDGRKIARIIAIVLAVLMVLTMVIPAISLLLGAVSIVSSISNIVVTQGGGVVGYIAPTRTYAISFNAVIQVENPATPPTAATGLPFNINSAWSRPDGHNLTIQFLEEENPNQWLVQVNATNLTYQSTTQVSRMIISGVQIPMGSAPNLTVIFDLEIPLHFEPPPPGWIPPGTTPPGGGGWNGGGSWNGNGDNSEDNGREFNHRIVIESVAALNSQGQPIFDVSENTDPFTLQVIFTDHGLQGVLRSHINEPLLAAFLQDTGRFVPMGSMRGTLSSIAAPGGDPPRFAATFNNIRYAGGAYLFAEFSFIAQYSIQGERHFGEGTARFFGIAAEDEDDDDDEPDPFTPNIVITEHSFGEGQVEAGGVFTLDMSFVNTSSELDLHNIIMEITPVSTPQQQSYLTIASATNTYFFETIPAGLGGSQGLDILVMAGAPQGSQAITVGFTFEFMVGNDLRSNSLNTTIHIPIVQVDRFTVSPITEYSDFVQLGSEGYVVVEFINLGQSAVSNIQGTVLDADENQVSTEHFGNLEAGQSNTLDFSFTAAEIGEQTFTVLIRYESVPGTQLEAETSFTVFVEEPPLPFEPDWLDVSGWEEPGQPDGIPLWRLMTFIFGGLFVAVPLALYMVKRAAVREGDEIFEDF